MSQASTQSDVAERFVHLLQPIRDLAENWDVDVASELEDYLEEIGKLTFTFDGSKEVFNFAEAALLVQGSACVYSKKVEYLYQLVYETLDLLASKKKLAQKSSLDKEGNDLDAEGFTDQDIEFLHLDDIAEDKNIDLVESATDRGANKYMTRTPMVLVPLEDCEKNGDSVLVNHSGQTFGNKSDFKMNTSIIHETGTLLLGVEDAQFLDQTFQAPNTTHSNTSVLNVPHAMPADGDDGGACAYDDDYDEGDGFVDDDDDDVVPNEGPNDGAGDVTAAVSHAPSTPAARRGTTAQSSRAADTVWTRLDAHDASAARGQRQPIRKIKSYRIPSHLNALDDAPTGDNVTGKKKKPTLLCPLSQFCSEAFHGASTMKYTLPKGIRAPAYSDFGALYSVEQKRKNACVRKQTQRVAAPGSVVTVGPTPQSATNALDLSAVPMELSAVGDDGMGDGDDGDYYDGYDDDDGGNDETHIEFDDVAATNAGAEGVMDGLGTEHQPDYGAASYQASQQSAASLTFEDLVRKHIEQYIAETQKYAVETDLSRRVQEWEDRIRPALEAESKRNDFDIHELGANVLQRFKKKDLGSTAAFSQITSTCKPYEVSRMFLAALQLANSGNLEIDSSIQGTTVQGAPVDGTCNMQLKLLSSDMHHVHDRLAPLLVA